MKTPKSVIRADFKKNSIKDKRSSHKVIGDIVIDANQITGKTTRLQEQ